MVTLFTQHLSKTHWILPQGVQGALLDPLREGLQGVRLPQEVLPGAQAALQADPGQGGEKGKLG